MTIEEFPIMRYVQYDNYVNGKLAKGHEEYFVNLGYIELEPRVRPFKQHEQRQISVRLRDLTVLNPEWIDYAEQQDILPSTLLPHLKWNIS